MPWVGHNGDVDKQTRDDESIVRALLSAAGIEAPDADVHSLTRAYPRLRRTVDKMYAVDVGDEVPAALFRADDR